MPRPGLVHQRMCVENSRATCLVASWLGDSCECTADRAGEEEVLEVLPGLGTPRYDPIEAVKFHTRITSKYYGDDYAVD